MHPRNPYKKPPSFKELALKNEEFRQQAKIDISGKVTIDFKNADALRALTRALLKEDWGLDVVLHPEYLVPTLPLRINYILWLEDLVAALNLNESGNPVYGIDIGTGASCIYPLLAAKKNGWHMVGVEKNEVCFNYAQQNVARNNLESLVKVRRNFGETIIDASTIKDSFQPDPNMFQFTMCNPPFFGSEEEVEKTNKSRSAHTPRPPPNNARTGSTNEVVVEGGEVAFVCKMIDESFQVKDRIKIFSTMLGHKTSVSKVLKYLKDQNICEISSTEFCQGQVTRWGLAWSHVVCLTCETLSNDIVGTKQKPKPPLRHVFPRNADKTFDSVVQKLLQKMDQLDVQYKCVIKDVKSVGYQGTAFSNTWSNQRRKRREQLKKDGLTPEGSGSEGTGATSPGERDDGPPPKKAKQSEAAPLVTLGFVLREEQTKEDTTDLVLDMCWLNGPGGRESVHQIMQYMKNNL